MALDIDTSIDESMNHEERACLALEAIADALTAWCKLEQQRFDKEYPVKVPRDAKVTTVPSDTDKLLENLGASDEPLEEWVGIREKEVIKKNK